MKERVTRTSLLFSAFVILLSFHADEMLVRFLLAGEIPGTRTSLPASVMLGLFATIFMTTVLLVILRSRQNNLSQLFDRIKVKLPKRRYSSLS